MKKFEILPTDIGFYFKKNRRFFFVFLICFLVGQVLGIIFVCSSDSYLNLISSSNKILTSYVNGSASYGGLFWSKLISFLIPLILIFILNLNFYVGLFSNVFIIYQSALFLMSNACVISLYGFGGVLSTIFISLPINLIYFAALSLFVVACGWRSFNAQKCKQFSFGFGESEFILPVVISIVIVVLLTIFAVLIYPLFFKNICYIVI